MNKMSECFGYRKHKIDSCTTWSLCQVSLIVNDLQAMSWPYFEAPLGATLWKKFSLTYQGQVYSLNPSSLLNTQLTFLFLFLCFFSGSACFSHEHTLLPLFLLSFSLSQHFYINFNLKIYLASLKMNKFTKIMGQIVCLFFIRLAQFDLWHHMVLQAPSGVTQSTELRVIQTPSPNFERQDKIQ